MTSPRGAEVAAILAKDYLTGEGFAVVPTAAGWWATTPVPSAMARHYPGHYYGEKVRRYPWLVEWLQSALYRRRARWVTRESGFGGKVLDIGCGPGHLLAHFRALGWRTVGTEFSPAAADLPRRRYGLDVRTGNLSDMDFPAESFDAVISWHTLEHMRDPRSVLEQSARLLKGGGLFLVSVPDFSSPEAQVKPSAWFHLDVPRHLVHFPAACLREQLRQCGFKIEAESYWAPEYDAFSLMQTWQNRMGLAHNLLYLLLKSAPPSGAARAARWQLAVAVVGGGLMLPFSAVVTLWRALTKRGAVIVLLARKIK